VDFFVIYARGLDDVGVDMNPAGTRGFASNLQGGPPKVKPLTFCW